MTRRKGATAPSSDSTNPKLSAEARTKACHEAIAKALQTYGCQLTSSPALVPDGIGGYRIVIRDIGCVALPEA